MFFFFLKNVNNDKQLQEFRGIFFLYFSLIGEMKKQFAFIFRWWNNIMQHLTTRINHSI